MLKASNNSLPPARVGDNILLPIEKPDMVTTLGNKNMMGVVVSNNDQMYSIGTSYGILEKQFTRNQFQLCPSKFLKIDNLPTSIIPQSTAMRNASQGVSYSCKCRNCSSSRCPCRKAVTLCNSRCHQGKYC